MAFDILSAVVNDIFVASPNQVKETLPWDIARLDDADPHISSHLEQCFQTAASFSIFIADSVRGPFD